MQTTQPITHENKVYDELAMSLAVSPLFRGDFLSASVVMTLTPLRRQDGVFETLDPEYQKTILFGDVFSSDDQDVKLAVGKIQAALQELINTKGL